MMEAKNIQEYIVESNYNDFIDVLGNEKIGKLYYKLLRIALDCSNHPEKHYKNHVIYKKDGSERRISICAAQDKTTPSACSQADFAATRPPYNAPNRELPPRRFAP